MTKVVLLESILSQSRNIAPLPTILNQLNDGDIIYRKTPNRLHLWRSSDADRKCAKNLKASFTKASTIEANVKILRQVRDTIAANYSRQFSLLDLSRECGISHFRLCRLFHQAYGIRANSYHQHLRLTKALRSIALETESNLTCLAYQSGFADLPSFSKCFKKWYGISPLSFIKTRDDSLQ